MKGECLQADTVATELSTAITAIKSGLADFSVTNLTTIWVAGLAVAAAPAIAWFAYRWVVRKANKAVFKGKL